jgi:hypothetical protein
LNVRSRLDDVRIAPLTDARQIADFVNEVWQAQYASDANLNIWPTAFFEWQFLQAPQVHPAICLGAFFGCELLGVYCGDIWSVFDVNGIEEKLTFISCVSVRKNPRRHQASSELLTAMRDWSEKHGSRNFFGFVNPSASTMVGRRYWTSRAGLTNSFMAGPRQWQILPERLAMVKEGGRVEDVPDLDRASLFLFRHLTAMTAGEQCAVHWPLSRVRHQLRFGTLADFSHLTDGEDQALCSYSIMPANGGWCIGYVDFLAATNSRVDLLRRALNDCLAKMRGRGCKRVLAMGAPTNRDEDLEALGFMPCIPSYAPLLGTWDNEPTFLSGARLAVVYR